VAHLHEYTSTDALGLAELVRRRQVTPLELVDAAIARIEALNPRLNAVVHTIYDRARRQASAALPPGPFSGVPFLLKDLLAMDAGVPATGSCRFLSRWVPPHDSELVRRFKAAGLVILGKTNTPEMGILPTTEPELRGPTRNPWDLTRTPGGSSGGSAAAVAARMTPVAHGNDGGGSIRIPASCCGVFGLKPTRARNPLGPDIGEGWHGMVAEHALTVSVRDSAALLDATAGPDAGAPYVAPPRERPYLEEVGREPGRLRIAFTTRSLFGEAVHPDCVAAAKDAARLCEKLGHHLEEGEPPIHRESLRKAFLVILAAETAAEIAQAGVLARQRPSASGFEPGTWFLGQVGRKFNAAELALAVREIHLAGRELGRWFEQHDLLMTPTLASPPPRLGELGPKRSDLAALAVLRVLPLGSALKKALDQLAEEAFEFAAFTEVANITGQPAMSVPLFWNAEGLPIGVLFVGRFGDEATLFRLAGQLERERPWATRCPPAPVAE
jgi:amidase